MLYKDWLDEWLTNYIRPSSKDKTYKRYVNVATKHLVPKLGHYELTDITPLVVQRYITELLQSGNLKNGKGLSPNSVNSMIVVIQGSMEMAFVLGMTPRYEMDKLKRPKAVEKEVEVFSPNEQKKLEAAVMSDKRSKMKGVMLCLYTGLRIGELLALEWTDVDFQRMEITVSKTCHDGTDENGKYTRIIETPKTENSRRVIPFPRQLLPMLREMKKDSTSPYVISGKAAVLSVRSYQRSFELLQRKLGIERRGFHALRHTFATRAIECGMDVKSLSEILGHKNPTITLKRYVHSLMEHKRELMNKLGKLIRRHRSLACRFFIHCEAMVYHRRTKCGVYHQARSASLYIITHQRASLLRNGDIQHFVLVIYKPVALMIYKAVALMIYKAVALMIYKAVTLMIYKAVALMIYKAVALVIYKAVALMIYTPTA